MIGLITTKASSVVKSNGYYYIPCSGSYDSVYFYMQDYYFEVRPESYLFGDVDCFIGFVSTSDEYFLIGDVFLREYYSIWNDDDSTLGLAPHIHTIATMLPGAAPVKSINTDPEEIDF